eukprot:scaffold14946_cov21-Tisochrysis_lutea.AAC.1
MAQKAREEVLQRQHAVMNHRRFFLNEDDAQVEEDGWGAGTSQEQQNSIQGRDGGGAQSPEMEYEVEEGEVLPPEAAARTEPKVQHAAEPRKGGGSQAAPASQTCIGQARPVEQGRPAASASVDQGSTAQPLKPQPDQDWALLQELDQHLEQQNKAAAAAERANTVAQHHAMLQGEQAEVEEAGGGQGEPKGLPSQPSAPFSTTAAPAAPAPAPTAGTATTGRPGGLKEAVAAAVAAATSSLGRGVPLAQRKTTAKEHTSSSSSSSS